MEKETKEAPGKSPWAKAAIPIGFAVLVLILILVGWGVQENPEVAPEREVGEETG